ncbi:MAG: hypothetical protein ACOCVF_00510 [bacterium]
MVNEEIYILTKHGNFSAEFIESIPIYRRRHFLDLLKEENEYREREFDKQQRKK